MRLDHIILSVVYGIKKTSFLIYFRPARSDVSDKCSLYDIVNNIGDHSGEVIPVPIPNTEVKLSYVDDTAIAGK